MSGWFLVAVLPAIIFFISIVQLLYYWGILQWVVAKFANIFFWAMKVSGAEAVAAAASPFVGQGENAVLIKPFIPYLTRAECHQIMCSGFATIAGSVLIVYISFGINPQALISSWYSILSFITNSQYHVNSCISGSVKDEDARNRRTHHRRRNNHPTI